MEPVTVRRLTKRYGTTPAVDDLSFECRRGAITGFLGPNGAGKTTTLRLLLGLARADSGEALICGSPYAELSEPSRTVGALLDHAVLHPGRTGRDHLRFVARAARLAPERVDEVLSMVGLSDAADRKAGGYSLGMRQRLGLANALLGDPDVLLLDEPANGLDPAGMRWLRQLLHVFVEDGGTVLISSHVLAEISQVADDLVIIGHGHVLAQAPIDEFSAGRSLEDAYLELTATTSEVR